MNSKTRAIMATQTNSFHSPKNRFRVQVTFDRPQPGIGSVVSYTSNSTKELISLAEAAAKGRPATLEIFENYEEYPRFDWRQVRSYPINR